MKMLTGDSRFILAMIAADAVEDTGRALAAWWRRSSRAGRLAQKLRDLEVGGFINHGGEERVDARIVRLTELGRRALFGDLDPPALWARPWDGRWRLTMFDVPQSSARVRTRLRRKLREMRFGWLQNSVWLSPDPVSDLLPTMTRQGLAVESLVFIEGRPVGGETDAELVAGAWDMPKLAKLHAGYLKLLRLRPASGRNARLSDWATWAATEDRAWRALMRVDPLLPASLLPREYTGRDVWQARLEALRAAGEVLAQVVARE